MLGVWVGQGASAWYPVCLAYFFTSKLLDAPRSRGYPGITFKVAFARRSPRLGALDTPKLLSKYINTNKLAFDFERADSFAVYLWK